MAYQIHREKKEWHETIELISEDGERKEKLEVVLSIPRLAGELRGTLLSLMHAQERVRCAAGENGEKQAEALREAEQAADRLLLLLFGEKNRDRLADFFDRDYIELIRQITPFVSEVVQPAVHRYVAECRKRAVKGRRHAGRN